LLVALRFGEVMLCYETRHSSPGGGGGALEELGGELVDEPASQRADVCGRRRAEQLAGAAEVHRLLEEVDVGAGCGNDRRGGVDLDLEGVLAAGVGGGDRVPVLVARGTEQGAEPLAQADQAIRLGGRPGASMSSAMPMNSSSRNRASLCCCSSR
jgi:hypothetical protein